MVKRIPLFALLLLVLIFAEAWSSVGFQARSLGMAGAYSAIARGEESVYFNPANLGLSGGPTFSLSFLSLGVDLGNNSFTLSDYNRYNGSYLSDGNKKTILSKIPSSGLSLDSGAEFGFLSLSYRNYGFFIVGSGASNITLPRDPFELILYGNELNRLYTIGDVDGEVWSQVTTGISAAKRLDLKGFDEFSVGASLKYLRGLYYAEVTRSGGSILTTESSIEGEGEIVYRHAQGGQGFSLDLGATGSLGQGWVVGLALFNPLGTLKWSRKTEEGFFTFKAESLTASSTKKDTLVASDDSSYEIGSFRSHLPSYLKIGVSRRFRKFLLGFDYEQGFRSRAGVSTTPRLSAGMEYNLLKWLPLRGGLAIGGTEGFNTALGLGLYLSGFQLDVSTSSRGLVFTPWSKGIGLAASFGLRFGKAPQAVLDQDNDGVPDKLDACPLQPEDADGFEDDDGCPDPDNDGDGIPDISDKCPNEPEDIDGYQDDDGCPDPDNDGDGVLDVEDNCPNEAGPASHQGCPIVDSDGDGVLDPDDRCPHTPMGVKIDRYGCPTAAKVVGKMVLEGVNFASGKVKFAPGSEAKLDELYESLKAYPDLKIEIQGYTDSRGSESANKALSWKRAGAVMDYLIKKGILPYRLKAIGYGEANPIASNKTRSGRAQNRRIEIQVF